jgi:hypothetical protein
MKKLFSLLFVLSFAVTNTVVPQGVLNRVKKAVSREISGTQGEDTGGNSSKTAPEPSSARDDARLIADLSKFKLDYNEMTICQKEDGSILIRDRRDDKYYLVKNEKAEGPLDEKDPRVTECIDVNEGVSDNQDTESWISRYPAYITQTGDKYLIKFNGKNFGPYAIISDFAVSNSKDKFAALVTENVLITEDQGKKMEEAMKNAKTDQERMDIAMKMSQQVSGQMMKAVDASSLQPKLISNVTGANYDAMIWRGGKLNSKVKYDDIVVFAYDKIIDLQGNTLVSLSQNSYNSKDLFLNSSGSKYAYYKYGTITFSDNTSISELFNLHLAKTDGKVYLTYMYYSPGKNAIMQASIPF